jgi:hypothetical protein
MILSLRQTRVDELRKECLKLKATTSNVMVLKGLDKLLLICDEAKTLDLSIYLMCD